MVITSYACDWEGRCMVVFNNSLGLENKKKSGRLTGHAFNCCTRLMFVLTWSIVYRRGLHSWWRTLNALRKFREEPHRWSEDWIVMCHMRSGCMRRDVYVEISLRCTRYWPEKKKLMHQHSSNRLIQSAHSEDTVWKSFADPELDWTFGRTSSATE